MFLKLFKTEEHRTIFFFFFKQGTLFVEEKLKRPQGKAVERAHTHTRTKRVALSRVAIPQGKFVDNSPPKKALIPLRAVILNSVLSVTHLQLPSLRKAALHNAPMK